MTYIKIFTILSAIEEAGIREIRIKETGIEEVIWMPQFDKRRSCNIPIEFNKVENLTGFPCPDRVALVLLTDGKAVVWLNDETKTLIAPCVLCLSEQDKIEVIENRRLYAQSFRLCPTWLKNRMTYKLVKNNNFSPPEEQLKDLLELFYYRDPDHDGIIDLSPDAYIKIFEWMGIIGTEIAAQSDGRWTCRTRAYFLRILNLLDKLYANARGARVKSGMQDPSNMQMSNKHEPYKQNSTVDVILEYLHTHYMESITLDMLCRKAHTNRTTLNKNFKERTGQPVIAYLLDYRIRVARELMAHTSLTIDEIARASGFTYDTYLIRQFTAKSGQSPTEYRNEARRKYGIVITKDI